MQMKKALLLIILLVSAGLCGCSKDADTLMAYTDHAYNTEKMTNYTITEGEFFAKDIVIISDGVNSGEDENLNAGAVLLIDISNNKTIYSSNAYDSMYPASLVKLLTSLIVIEDGELTDKVTISQNAVKIAEKRAKVCGFKEGDTMSMDTLLNCLLVFSGNDAAIAIAEHIGGTESDFIALMNKKALQLGAAASVFANPHGLHDDTQYTTAYDMYLIFNKLLKYDSFRTVINKKIYEAEYFDKSGNNKHKSLTSTNLYLTGDVKTDDGLEVIGGISGSTKMSGSCIILLCRDSNNTEYIAVILNAANNEVMYTQMSYLLSLAVSE